MTEYKMVRIPSPPPPLSSRLLGIAFLLVLFLCVITNHLLAFFSFILFFMVPCHPQIAEEEATSSSFGYEAADFGPLGLAASGGGAPSRSLQRRSSLTLQCGEDSGAESEAESEVGEGSEDSYSLGATPSSFRIPWEFYRGTFSEDSVETIKEWEIKSFDDFQMNWGRICCLSSLSQGSLVQFFKRDPSKTPVRGHWVWSHICWNTWVFVVFLTFFFSFYFAVDFSERRLFRIAGLSVV